MKKVMAVGFGCFALTIGVNSRGFAVWPPSTSFQEEAGPPARQDLPLSERMERDIRRLEEALKDLKEDQQELKQTHGVPGANEKPAAVPQEDPDGRRIH